MKSFTVLFFLALLAAGSAAQIKLEHTYSYGYSVNSDFKYRQVDSGIWKYVFFNGKDSISLYNTDHSLDHTFTIPLEDTNVSYFISDITRRLFDTDDQYEFVVAQYNGASYLRVFKEDGTTVFGCQNCSLNSIEGSNAGSKMLIDYYDDRGYRNQTGAFSLPGKIPTDCIAKTMVQNVVGVAAGNTPPLSAYPNPSNGVVHIAYQLPEGVATGEIILTDISGKEIKRFRVGNIFKEILVEPSELQSGTYFYKVISAKGESEAKRIVVVK